LQQKHMVCAWKKSVSALCLAGEEVMRYQFSPNFNDRPTDEISFLVLHYTGMATGDAALSRMCDVNAQVSAHYLVDEDGSVVQLVDEGKRAWHAGISSWRGVTGLNDVSIGIEIVNPGHEFGYRPFFDVQMCAVVELSREILRRHPLIVARNVVAHSDIAPDRKQDPGELFDWPLLAAHGVGQVVRESVPQGYRVDPPLLAMQKLSSYGYKLDVVAQWGAEAELVAVAFQRHFRPRDISGVWDAECTFILDKLLEMS
jgi:N-acetylmuramoyl-L-alanine amidase